MQLRSHKGLFTTSRTTILLLAIWSGYAFAGDKAPTLARGDSCIRFKSGDFKCKYFNTLLAGCGFMESVLLLQIDGMPIGAEEVSTWNAGHKIRISPGPHVITVALYQKGAFGREGDYEYIDTEQNVKIDAKPGISYIVSKLTNYIPDGGNGKVVPSPPPPPTGQSAEDLRKSGPHCDCTYMVIER